MDVIVTTALVWLTWTLLPVVLAVGAGLLLLWAANLNDRKKENPTKEQDNEPG